MTRSDRPGTASPGLGVLRATLAEWLRLREDTDPAGTIRQVTEAVEFRGGTLWSLAFAILIASVGLNVNSTAVIIGAMLISPLMGPIVAAGLGLGINDLVLLKRGLRNLVAAALVSVLVSALYFRLSPLHEAVSELLARTRPTLYDVLIALFAGAAGMVAASRRGDRGQVVPGVAIATALIPPLCTAGFGLATGNWRFLFGALYLFLINSVFICLATLVVVRALKFPRVHAVDPERERRVRLAIGVAVAVTVIPSAWVAWNVVQETVFLSAARRFIGENFGGTERSVLGSTLRYGRDSSTIEITLVGRPLPPEHQADLRRRLPASGLGRTRLIIREPMAAADSSVAESQALRAGVLEQLYRQNETSLAARDARIRILEDEVVRLRAVQLPLDQLSREATALYPDLTSLGFGRIVGVAGGQPADTAIVIITGWRRPPDPHALVTLEHYFRARLNRDSVEVVIRPHRP